MKAIIFAVALIVCAGCSHNAINYSDGIGFETTFRPDTGNFGFTFRYGKILSAVLRENSKVNMTGEGQANGESGAKAGASNSGNVEVEIGRQITGYYVDAIKAGAKAEDLDKYTSQ